MKNYSLYMPKARRRQEKKVEILLFDTNAITLGNENFMGGEAEITENERENDMDFYENPNLDEISFSGSNRKYKKSKKWERS